MSRIPAMVVVLLLSFGLTFASAQAAPALQLAIEFEGAVLENANLREGPGTDSAVIGRAEAGEVLAFDRCNRDCEWYHLETGEWIAGFLIAPLPMQVARSADELMVGPPSLSAKEIVSEILSFLGLPRHFAILSANIYDAAAFTIEGQRIILYDPSLMEDIEYVTDNLWAAISILAHEIGHHLAGHTLSTKGEMPLEYRLQAELEVGHFSGFVLYKMGADLEEAQLAMQVIGSDESTATHPSMADRLTAIEAGWREAARQRRQGAQLPSSTSVMNNSQDFSPLIFCDPDEFNTSVGECKRYRTLFSGVVESVYVSWTPPASYKGSEFTRKWYLDGLHFLTNLIAR